MILLIDNYDSFVYNLYQLIGKYRPDITVARNREITLEEIRAMAPEAIFLSPGPGRPEDSGICLDILRELGKDIPVFGVCLGHQAITYAFGGTVSYAKTLMHGKASLVTPVAHSRLFGDDPVPFQAARYHSLAATALPPCLIPTAYADDGEIMALEHRDYPIYGVQFHPESILTPAGDKLIQSFFTLIGGTTL
jgi:anthranilate synthase component 2